MNIDKALSEITYKAVRSSGPGGQNVNKVSSKVVLSFNLLTSDALDDEEKALAQKNLQNRLTNDDILILNCDEDRSQLKNKEIVTKRFIQILQNALVVPKLRKRTKVPKSVIRKRLKDKKNVGEIKKNRRKPDF